MKGFDLLLHTWSKDRHRGGIKIHILVFSHVSCYLRTLEKSVTRERNISHIKDESTDKCYLRDKKCAVNTATA